MPPMPAFAIVCTRSLAGSKQGRPVSFRRQRVRYWPIAAVAANSSARRGAWGSYISADLVEAGIKPPSFQWLRSGRVSVALLSQLTQHQRFIRQRRSQRERAVLDLLVQVVEGTRFRSVAGQEERGIKPHRFLDGACQWHEYGPLDLCAGCPGATESSAKKDEA